MASKMMLFLLFLLVISLCGCVEGKECTNIPTQTASHTLRSQLRKDSWEMDLLSIHHSTSTDKSAYMDLLPRKLLERESKVESFDWTTLYQSLKSSDEVSKQQMGESFLKEVSLHDVRLDPDSVHGQAQRTNLEYLLLLDVDRLVWSFRKQAGLSTPGTPYGGWEGPDVELRGHFVGHYMSASALMWASTHNDTLREKMTLVVDELNACQKKIGTGYLSAFPTEFFDRYEAIKSVWAPYYTIHKIMAGLLDQYTLAGNSRALSMVTWMAEYFGNRVKNVIQKYTIERHWMSLNEETGGMNDVLYKLYNITGDQKHLVLAHLFDKPCFLGLLALQTDGLSGFHSNTHIPVVIGAQRRYETIGDPLYKEIATYFMDIVNSSHSYATGGTSVSEFWSDPMRLGGSLTTEDEESCTTYNMLKVARNLFRWTKEMVYADYYERALTNGVLGIQRGTEPGVMIYMLPQGPGKSKAVSYHGWGTKFDSFWCCYGTGIESFSKLGDSIYFEELGIYPALYIVQYIPGTFNWKNGGIRLSQKIEPFSSLQPILRISFNISFTEASSQSSTLNFRIPFWIVSSANGAKGRLNFQELNLPDPGNFLSITRKWGRNDYLELLLPISLWTETIKDDRPEFALVQAIFFGPYLLAGLSDGDWDINAQNSSAISDWIAAIPELDQSLLISLTQESSNRIFVVINSNNTLKMDELPKAGTASALHVTFRLLPHNTTNQSFHPSQGNNLLGKYVKIEPFDQPGMYLTHLAPNNSIIISAYAGKNSNYLFQVVPGMDGNSNSVSLESGNKKGCFLHSGVHYSKGSKVQLMCKQEDPSFRKAVSFLLNNGLRQYHPISFRAKGVKRDFILEPLMSLMDETYTVYFNITH